mgnify:CR=1 FL=1
MSDLNPSESMALTVALAQVLRGEAPSTNVAILCVLGLARLDGRHDWTEVAYQQALTVAAERQRS